MLTRKKYKCKVGFDTCFSPILFKYLKNACVDSIETCEAGRFSCYISSSGKLYPCSFLQKKEYEVDLKYHTIEQGWYSTQFDNFRETKCQACKDCKNNNQCSAGCKGKLNQYICN